MRDLNARLLAPVLRLTGFRFSKRYRHGEGALRRLVYRCVNTILANVLADGPQL